MNSSRALAAEERLAHGKECLDYVEAERLRLGDPAFGKGIEQGIISRELLELELEDAEARITSLCRAAERALDLLA